MRFAYAFALALVLVLTTGAVANDIVPPYNPHKLAALLNDPKVKNQLKITKEQEKGVQASLDKWRKASDGDSDTIFKMKGTDKEKFAQVRALGTKRGDQLLKWLGGTVGP
jgi:hypothetical protein